MFARVSGNFLADMQLRVNPYLWNTLLGSTFEARTCHVNSKYQTTRIQLTEYQDLDANPFGYPLTIDIFDLASKSYCPPKVDLGHPALAIFFVRPSIFSY